MGDALGVRSDGEANPAALPSDDFGLWVGADVSLTAVPSALLAATWKRY
ncbi:hypothetical protein QWY75_13495 [Pontixanthobacter aestiaquae]|uniref:Uncharacterized protein n=1 Tax=Pontixanthobacter aestiaquae TaxID=1509367 RepID=A0A844Z2U1_9SPHN|nr:hypothetical protein [Pontixanthobacter aestiaquae]MDN3647220.1 hypothetical protein [Pontixanthobacter aestiaquae]MXO81804.1 hypothetical protein [Pontixanthobacter aestiaquae]